jgi:AcrR family transcriptional regulator
MTADLDAGALLAGPAAEALDPASEAILDAARAALVEHGLRRTSLDDIARLAGVSRATLFRRFPNRDALLVTLVAREAQRLIARVDEHVDLTRPPQRRVVDGFLAFVTEVRRHDLLRRLVATDPETILPLLTTDAEPVIALGRTYLAGHLRRAQEDGAELTGDPEHIAELLARIAHSLAIAPGTTLPVDDPTRLAAFARTTLAPIAFRST